MISLAKWKILTPLQKLSNNVGDLAKIIFAIGFKKLAKLQKIAQSGHTGADLTNFYETYSLLFEGGSGKIFIWGIKKWTKWMETISWTALV